mmetsp:Transcript_15430/g.38252  ORF Transcript_15430/g.38252 Transcript_15430/m.38252 type:complete len:310 (-) Transcript_15430:546-1475(-)
MLVFTCLSSAGYAFLDPTQQGMLLCKLNNSFFWVGEMVFPFLLFQPSPSIFFQSNLIIGSSFFSPSFAPPPTPRSGETSCPMWLPNLFFLRAFSGSHRTTPGGRSATAVFPHNATSFLFLLWFTSRREAVGVSFTRCGRSPSSSAHNAPSTNGPRSFSTRARMWSGISASVWKTFPATAPRLCVLIAFSSVSPSANKKSRSGANFLSKPFRNFAFRHHSLYPSSSFIQCSWSPVTVSAWCFRLSAKYHSVSLSFILCASSPISFLCTTMFPRTCCNGGWNLPSRCHSGLYRNVVESSASRFWNATDRHW